MLRILLLRIVRLFRSDRNRTWDELWIGHLINIARFLVLCLSNLSKLVSCGVRSLLQSRIFISMHHDSSLFICAKNLHILIGLALVLLLRALRQCKWCFNGLSHSRLARKLKLFLLFGRGTVEFSTERCLLGLMRYIIIFQSCYRFDPLVLSWGLEIKRIHQLFLWQKWSKEPFYKIKWYYVYNF